MFSGTNVYETRAGNIQYSQHAEMSALLEFIKFTYGKHCNFNTYFKSLRGKSPIIYVVRLTSCGYHCSKSDDKNMCGDKCWFGNSQPCINCQTKLKKYGIEIIKYTTVIDDITVLCELKLN